MPNISANQPRKSFQETIISIWEKSLGPDHPDLAAPLKGYALLLRETKRKSEAKAMDAHVKEILAKHQINKPATLTVHVGDLDSTARGLRN